MAVNSKVNEKEKTLVIVESPAKSKTISKILGPNYLIHASMGHVRDLASKGLGFDIENNFKPTFEIIPEKKKVIAELNKIAKTVDRIYLASDPDREGEAIAWHVRECLKFPQDKIFRIVFNEITPNAIKEAVANYHDIDMLKVEAQKTRQILDKLVGFKISPLLWEKMKNYKLSAGRVQSVALKMICEREDEIEAFVPSEYWSIDALLNKSDNPTFNFIAELSRVIKNGKDEKLELKSKKDTDEVLAKLKGAKYVVSKINSRDTKRNPQPPFITSTLQREASSKLGYGVSKTMQIAQKLYEGIDLGDGSVGLITYMRTDSTRISDEAQATAKSYIEANFGEEYYPKTPNNYVKKKQNVQDAHEAIRPSYIEKTPESIKKYLTSEQYKLYKLIWERFMASQMSCAKVKNLTVDIEANGYIFKMGSSKIMFDGFTKIYNDEETQSAKMFPSLEVGDELNLKDLISEQHFTQPPARFSEATLVKQLEEYGIGRPSTYAPIITKIQQRNYVEKVDNKALKPTPLGRVVCKQLVEHFVNIMDYKFTARMEEKLDEIAENKEDGPKTLNMFWSLFSKALDQASKNMKRVDVETDKVCPNCGKTMVVKLSRYGKQFLACSGYPECKTALPMEGSKPVEIPEDEPTDKKCEKCGGDMVIKTGPYGKYYQCLDDKCKKRYSIVESSGVKCPECAKKGIEGELVKRKSRYGTFFWGCSKYPDCSFALWAEPNGEKCPDCGSLLVKKYLKRGNKIACSNKNCKYSKAMDEE
ncbi:MAG: type I DNA topoisomerase [Candidatus Gastranaerophilales bacterium]|nr:type I DNA topoisomerase [Candidatus Gastranaerophilales bacterium]